MSFANIQRRTIMALGLALILHVGLISWLKGKEFLIEVPLYSENISTQIGIYQPPAPQALVKPKVRPVTPPKPRVEPQRKPVVKKVISANRPKDFSVAPTKKETAPTNAKPVAKPLAAAKAPANNAGAKEKSNPTDIRKYINRVVRKIDRKKRYPRLAKSNGEQGTVRVKITLGKGGQLLAYRLVGKPPFARLGKATVATVQAAAPFPPLPNSYQKAKMTIEVPVRFRLASRR